MDRGRAERVVRLGVGEEERVVGVGGGGERVAGEVSGEIDRGGDVVAEGVADSDAIARRGDEAAERVELHVEGGSVGPVAAGHVALGRSGGR